MDPWRCEAGCRGCRTAACTAGLDRFLPDDGLTIRADPVAPLGGRARGSQTFCNVPLAIGGMLCLWGEANAKSGQPYPEKVDGIPVRRKFDTLYVYHAAFYDSLDGSPVYHLTFQYEDGTSSMTTICYGAHLRNWWQMADEAITELTDSKSKTAWRGDPPDRKREGPSKLRFSITSITNPRPALEVKSISLASAKGNSAGCILAMTTGPANLLRVDQSRSK